MGSGLFFDSGGDRLYGFFHPPIGTPRSTGVVFVHGAFEERQDAHLVLRDAAERLAARGFPALRFDLYGHGDSEGEYSQATLSRWVADTIAATRALSARADCARFALVGLRLGAIVATRAAVTCADRCERIVLWQPVLSGRAYLNEIFRAHGAAEMVSRRRATTRDAIFQALERGVTANIFGYPLAPALFREIASADLASDLAASAVATLVIDVVRQAGARGVAELDALTTTDPNRVKLDRVVEPQPLYAEGKYFVARADGVMASTVRFMESGT